MYSFDGARRIWLCVGARYLTEIKHCLPKPIQTVTLIRKIKYLSYTVNHQEPIRRPRVTMSTHEIPVTVPVSHIHPFTLFDDLVHFSLALCHRSETSFSKQLVTIIAV